MLPLHKHWHWLLWPLCLLAFLWMRPVFSFPFFGDDLRLNLILRPLEASDVGAYFSPRWGWVYRPLMLIYWAGMMCLTDGVGAYHVVSVLLHLGSSALTGLLFYRLVNVPEQRRRAVSLASGVGGFFWLGQGETVRIASNASVLFCFCFILCALHCFLSFRQNGKPVATLGFFAAFLLALGFKEEAMVIPVLCLLLDICFLPPKESKKLRTHWLYGVMGLVLCSYVGLSLVAAASIDPVHPKIVTIPRHFSLLNVADFILHLLGKILSTNSSVLNLAIIGALAALILRQHSKPARGAFWMVAAIATPVPLLIGSYALGSDRFFYMPSLFLLMAGAVLLSTTQTKVSQAGSLLIVALLGATGREVLEFLGGRYWFYSDVVNAFLLGDVLVPCSLGASLLFALLLWRKGLFDERAGAVVVLVALFSQSLLWPTFPWLGEVFGLLAFVVCAYVFSSKEKNEWIEGVLMCAALWRLPALTLPLMLGFWELWQLSAKRSLLASNSEHLEYGTNWRRFPRSSRQNQRTL